MTTSDSDEIALALPPYKNAYVRRMIQSNAAHYIDVWKRLENGGFKFHWPAMIFTEYWLLFRKMYGLFALVIVADILLLLVFAFLSQFLSILLWVYFLGRLIIPGIYGHKAYRWHVRQKLEEITAKTEDEQERVRLMMGMGGTSTLAIIVGIVAGALLSQIVLALLNLTAPGL